jgi:hypothetical protein
VKSAALLLTLLVGVPARADDAMLRCRRKPDLRYVISGAALFGFGFTLSLALAIRYEEGELAVPVLGPLIDLRRCRDCTASPVERGVVAGLVLDAVLQAAGASLLVLGMMGRKPPRVSLAPTANGILVGGRF